MPKDNEKLQRADADAPTIDEDTFVKKSEKLSVNEKRIKFKAERIRGSINLFGGTIDDIILNDYFESIEKKKNVHILNKENSDSPYFLRLGWASTDKSLELPNKNSLWKVFIVY